MWQTQGVSDNDIVGLMLGGDVHKVVRSGAINMSVSK